MSTQLTRLSAAIALAAVLTSAAWPAVADAAPPRFGDAQPQHPRTQKYTCATGKILSVTYLSAINGQSFAIVPVKGRPMLFVNTVSGSGAKYQAGSYTWWTKGPRADLYDLMAGPDAPPIVSDCVTINR
ncbi:MAG TPA: MliC family protein [Paraburkholderia sp.]|jgi:membrane-bound inhibitor of C-type lysozyme|nr:MliC family protein [Paraburkholderia sp.]